MSRKSSAARHVSQPAAQTPRDGDTAIAETDVRHLPLARLALSPANVRKTPATEAEDAELEASIRAKGILQNLIVHVIDDGLYHVDAGGRRLTILQKLAAEGVIDAIQYKVPCRIEQPDDAIETSLAENTVRANMHPADEFTAMAALIDAGAMIDDVARRFGSTERHVRQRLRLGKLAPELLDAYRAGDIDLEGVTAFTLGADHPAQLAVWNQLKDHSYISPHRVRHLLTETAIALDSDLGRFVGAEAYKTAGGTMNILDLFSEDGEGFMDDAALVRRLAIEKLEAKAEALRGDWAWTKAVLDPEYGFTARYARLQPKPGILPAELEEERERIEQRLGELEETDGDALTDELMADAARLEERRDQIDEIEQGLGVYSKKDRKRAGCIVTIGEDGGFELHQGLVERGAANIGADADDDGDCDIEDSDESWAPDGEGEDGNTFSASRAARDADTIRASADAEMALRKQCGFRQSLVDDLKAHRLQITRAYLAENFEVAFDLALYELCTDLLEHYGYRSHSLDLRATENQPRSSMNDLKGTPADNWLGTQRQVLELGWLKLPPAQGFAALAALPPQEKQRLFAWCIAATLKPQLSIEGHADPAIEAAGGRLGIGFEDYWRPTAANYWGRVKKAHGLAIGAEILGERWARDHADDKKPVLAAALETAFDINKSGACVSLGQAARNAAAAWLPPGMAFDGTASAASADPGIDAAGDANNGDAVAVDPASGDLPAFLTTDEPSALNGAEAP